MPCFGSQGQYSKSAIHKCGLFIYPLLPQPFQTKWKKSYDAKSPRWCYSTRWARTAMQRKPTRTDHPVEAFSSQPRAEIQASFVSDALKLWNPRACGCVRRGRAVKVCCLERNCETNTRWGGCGLDSRRIQKLWKSPLCPTAEQTSKPMQQQHSTWLLSCDRPRVP